MTISRDTLVAVIVAVAIAITATWLFTKPDAASVGTSSAPVCTIDGDRSNDLPGCIMPATHKS